MTASNMLFIFVYHKQQNENYVTLIKYFVCGKIQP